MCNFILYKLSLGHETHLSANKLFFGLINKNMQTHTNVDPSNNRAPRNTCTYFSQNISTSHHTLYTTSNSVAFTFFCVAIS